MEYLFCCASCFGCCIVAMCTECCCGSKNRHKKITSFLLQDSTSIVHSEETELFRDLQGTFQILNVRRPDELTACSLLGALDSKNFVVQPKFADEVPSMENRQIIVTGRQFAFLPKVTTGSDEDSGHKFSTEHSVMKMRKKNNIGGMYYLLKEDESFVDTDAYGSGSGFLILRISKVRKTVEVVHLNSGLVFIWKNIDSVLTLPPAPTTCSEGNRQASSSSHQAAKGHQDQPSDTARTSDQSRYEDQLPSYEEACRQKE